MFYKICITCILGPKGVVVELPDNQQTKERLERRIIEPYEPTERKILRPTERKASKRTKAKEE